MQSRSSIMAAGSLAVLAIAWGAIPLFVRNDVPSTVLVGARVTFGALALIAVAAAVGRLRWPSGRAGRVAVCGVLLAAHWVTFFESIKYASVAVALAILYVGPIAAAILAGPILGERVGRRLWTALAIAAAGTVLVVQPWADQAEVGVTPRGIGMAVLSAALLAALLLVGKPAAKDLGGLTMAIGELTVASIVLLPATYEAVTTWREFWVTFLILGAVFTGLAGFVYWESMRRLPMAAVSVIMYLEPASAVVWAAAFLDEIPNPIAWIGVGMVIAGGAIAALDASDEVEVMHAPAAL